MSRFPRSPRSSARLFRYRFSSMAEARKHLHTVEGRQLLYLPWAAGTGLGDRVLLELSVAGSEQTCTLTGEVRCVESALYAGAWAELDRVKALESVEHAVLAARRRTPRLSADLLVRAGRLGRPGCVARLCDVGLDGARLAGVGGLWSAGEQVQIGALGELGNHAGRVVWARAGEAALRFDAPAHSLLQLAAEAWNQATDLAHPAACRCVSGGPLVEPLLPRSLRRRALERA